MQQHTAIPHYHRLPGHACLACLVALHGALIETDHLYATQQDEHANQLVVDAQQRYYAHLLRYNRQTYSTEEARYRSATALWRRAQQNRKRLPDNPIWQQMATYQERRARTVRAHAMALWDDYKPDTQRILEKEQERAKRANPPTPRAPRRVRVVHPLTRRYVYREQE